MPKIKKSAISATAKGAGVISTTIPSNEVQECNSSIPMQIELGPSNSAWTAAESADIREPTNQLVNIEATSPIVNTAAQTIPGLDQTDDDKKKRRGRKPKDKFAYDDVSVSKPEELVDTDNNIVIKIPISYMELDKEFNISASEVYSSNIPKPFEKINTDSTYKYLSDAESSYSGQMIYDNDLTLADCNKNTTHTHEIISDILDSNKNKQLTQVEILLEKKYKHTRQISLLSNICINNNSETWLDKTNSACYWDCHCFDHQPWGIPTKYNYLTGQFTLFGIFCSPNCAMSYLLTYETNISVLWERVSLLNLLYYKIYENDDNIIPAPDKICLKLFGGPFDISEYRALTLKNNKIYNINFPPCNIINPVLEETKKVFNQESYFIPNDKKKHNKIQTELKIKRTRPITTNKNTLDSILSRD